MGKVRNTTCIRFLSLNSPRLAPNNKGTERTHLSVITVTHGPDAYRIVCVVLVACLRLPNCVIILFVEHTVKRFGLFAVKNFCNSVMIEIFTNKSQFTKLSVFKEYIERLYLDTNRRRWVKTVPLTSSRTPALICANYRWRILTLITNWTHLWNPQQHLPSYCKNGHQRLK